MKRFYCTYFDSKYLLKGIALLRSLLQHESNKYSIWVVCMDKLSQSILESLAIPSVITISIDEVEKNDAELLKAKTNRSSVEYLWTCTPTIIRWLMENVPEIDILTYLDADLFFFSSPDPVFQELDQASVMIHEHRFPPELRYLETYGKYNVGLMSFRRNEEAMVILSWWRKRCLEWCYSTYDSGKFADQAYLNDWPIRFTGVKVLEHIGAGLAPWNHSQYHYSCDMSGRLFVDSLPVVFYHFHKFSHLLPEIHIPLACELYKLPMDIVKFFVRPYLEALINSLIEVRKVSPEFSTGFEPTGSIDVKFAFIAHVSAAESLRQMKLPHQEIKIDDQWILYASEQIV